jgi:hypothetical protein
MLAKEIPDRPWGATISMFEELLRNFPKNETPLVAINVKFKKRWNTKSY